MINYFPEVLNPLRLLQRTEAVYKDVFLLVETFNLKPLFAKSNLNMNKNLTNRM